MACAMIIFDTENLVCFAGSKKEECSSSQEVELRGIVEGLQVAKGLNLKSIFFFAQIAYQVSKLQKEME